MEISDEGKENEEINKIVENYETQLRDELISIRNVLATIVSECGAKIVYQSLRFKQQLSEIFPLMYGESSATIEGMKNLDPEMFSKPFEELIEEIKKIEENIESFEKKYNTEVSSSLKSTLNSYKIATENFDQFIQEFYRELIDEQSTISQKDVQQILGFCNYLLVCKENSEKSKGKMGKYPLECREAIYNIKITFMDSMPKEGSSAYYLKKGVEALLSVCKNCPYVPKFDPKKSRDPELRSKDNKGGELVYDFFRSLGLDLPF